MSGTLTSRQRRIAVRRVRPEHVVTIAEQERLSGSGVPTAATFATLVVELDAAGDLSEVLAHVLEFAVTHLDCQGATVDLLPTGGQPAITMASDPRLAAVDARSRADSSRPCEGLVVELTDGRSTFGTMTFYPAQPDGFGPSDIANAELLVVHVALAITTTRTAAYQLAAIDARAAFGQALGIVMERYALDADAASALLRRCSQENNLTLQEVTNSLIATRRLPDGRAGAGDPPMTNQARGRM